MKASLIAIGLLVVNASLAAALSPAKVTVEHATSAEEANVFPTIASASKNDAGILAKFRLLEGRLDPNSAEVEVLNDGLLPTRSDEPRSNFFLAGAGPARLLVELVEPCELKQIRTYSRHPSSRGPQRYSIYVRDNERKATREQLEVAPNAPASGWQLLAEVDTRSAGHSEATTAVAVTPNDEAATLGEHRYLLLVIEKGEPDDPYGNTFYSEIDLDDGREHAPPPLPEGRSELVIDDTYRIEFDTTETPKLTPWVERVLKPACAEWYPKIVAQLPSEGYRAPQQFKIVFKADMDGVAYTSGTRVVCAEKWFTNNLAGEATGAVVHELVHIAQQYSRRPNPTPSCVVEGIADYIRWFQYEPKENRPGVNFDRANYNDSYRTTGAFFDFLARTYDENLPTKLNDTCRQGKYTEGIWEELTGKKAEELWKEFAKSARAGQAGQGS